MAITVPSRSHSIVSVGAGLPVQMPGLHVSVWVPLIAGGAVFCGATAGTLRGALVAVALPPALVPVTRHAIWCVASAPVST